jgi:aryl-alcohol dehydrogenase-like predicted oxidoreductase|tara:strand:+ start:206 stop:1237 length:1032 start_codon:yes stop_codon:yes gene_type:complete
MLGNSGINVSIICLGTMTYGEQNTEKEGHRQLDFAIDEGVNFIDSAELYAIPPKVETYGKTESIIGSWLSMRGRRNEVILASKIAGGGEWVNHIRGGKTRFTEDYITEAISASLKRLRTDYIDLYQLHWPERNTNYFGKLGYEAGAKEAALTPIAETLRALKKQVEAGKIRYVGLSNETPWGIMQFLTLAKEYDLPVIVSVQNPYNLLNRSYEIGNAEISHRENVSLLAYSPLGFGVLSGKYLNNKKPAEARITKWPNYVRYSSEQGIAATGSYVGLAMKYGLDPAQMALAFVNAQSFVASNIIGATTMLQLESNIASVGIQISRELRSDIEKVHNKYPNPSP